MSCVMVTALQSVVLALDFEGIITLNLCAIGTALHFNESPELGTWKVFAHFGVCLTVAFVTYVVTMVNNHTTVAEELMKAEGPLKDCELQTHIIRSENINFGVFAVRLPLSTFGNPEVIHANIRTNEITACKNNESLVELLQAKHIVGKIADHLEEFQIS